MTDRFRANRQFKYPANAESLALVLAAGGIAKLTPEDRAKVTFKRVDVGGDCSDMPAESIPLRLARGEITRLGAVSPTPELAPVRPVTPLRAVSGIAGRVDVFDNGRG